MLNITLNGESCAFPDAALSVAALVTRLGYAGKRIAVEKNGEIVPKSQHETAWIASGDTLEIVVAVGGG
jgi:sulfur carrier protein